MGLRHHHRCRRESHTVVFVEEGEPMDCCFWDAISDLINPRWVTWVREYDVERPETPYDPRNTDDASQRILEMYLRV